MEGTKAVWLCALIERRSDRTLLRFHVTGKEEITMEAFFINPFGICILSSVIIGILLVHGVTGTSG
jgi:hypothetical protein